MGGFLTMVGIGGFLGSFIGLIILAVKKYPKKNQWGATIGVIVSLIIFFIGTSTSQPSTVAQAAVTSSSISEIQSSKSNTDNKIGRAHV